MGHGLLSSTTRWADTYPIRFCPYRLTKRGELRLHKRTYDIIITNNDRIKICYNVIIHLLASILYYITIYSIYIYIL